MRVKATDFYPEDTSISTIMPHRAYSYFGIVFCFNSKTTQVSSKHYG